MEDNQLSEKQLQALLRLKRHEQPPPGYFDDLLSNIHRRQREDLLRRPAWRLFVDRLRGFFSSWDWNYAATLGAILVLGIGAIQLALPAKKHTLPISNNLAGNVAPQKDKPTARNGQATPPPTRFVMEPMPASYEPTPIRF